MNSILSRRSLLKTAGYGALGSSGLLAGCGRSAVANQKRLIIRRRTIDVLGRAATVFGIHQPDGKAGIVLEPGERFIVRLENMAGETTTVHWHGQTPPPAQDGIVDFGVPSIPPGGDRDYNFAPRAGTHWMHSHFGLQEQRLMAAPLIVRTAEDVRMDVQEAVVLLHDFTFGDPAKILAKIVADSKNPGGSAMQAMTMAQPRTNLTRSPPDLNDIAYDAYLANDRTLADPEVIPAERGGRIRLRLINGATSSAFWIDLGTLSGEIIAVDGNPVVPTTSSRFPMTQGQRVDVVVRLPSGGGAFPILAQREGDAERTGIILATPGAAVAKIDRRAETAAPPVDLSLEQNLIASHPLSARPNDIAHKVALTGNMIPYAWSIDSRDWAHHRPLRISRGQRVVIDMVNQTPMAHPMHLHGHHFQVVGLNGRPINGAVRDTVLVPLDATVRIAFDADNPGRWLFHCHNLLHMATGMITEVSYL